MNGIYGIDTSDNIHPEVTIRITTPEVASFVKSRPPLSQMELTLVKFDEVINKEASPFDRSIPPSLKPRSQNSELLILNSAPLGSVMRSNVAYDGSKAAFPDNPRIVIF
jgi:hypothetical protein